MALEYNGNKVKRIVYNGNELNRLVYNGTAVEIGWHKIATNVTNYPYHFTTNDGLVLTHANNYSDVRISTRASLCDTFSEKLYDVWDDITGSTYYPYYMLSEESSDTAYRVWMREAVVVRHSDGSKDILIDTHDDPSLTALCVNVGVTKYYCLHEDEYILSYGTITDDGFMEDGTVSFPVPYDPLAERPGLIRYNWEDVAYNTDDGTLTVGDISSGTLSTQFIDDDVDTSHVNVGISDGTNGKIAIVHDAESGILYSFDYDTRNKVPISYTDIGISSSANGASITRDGSYVAIGGKDADGNSIVSVLKRSGDRFVLDEILHGNHSSDDTFISPDGKTIITRNDVWSKC